MKKSKVILAIIVMAILTIVVVVASCKKEKQDIAFNNDEQGAQISENMDEYMKSFKEKLLSSEKSQDLLSLDEARINLGNLLNFDFDDANYATNVYHIDTLHVIMTLTDGQVELSHLAEVYLNAFNQILDAYNAINIPEKSVYGIHCEIANKEKSNNADVEISLITRGFMEEPILLDFDEDECRNTVNGGGRCDTVGIGGYGAIQMIAFIANNRLNSNYVLPACPHGQRVIYDEQSFHIFRMNGYNSDFDTLSPIGGQELYTNHHIYDTCLCYESLHYFLEKTIEISYEHKPAHHIIYFYNSYLDGNDAQNNCGWQVLNVFYRRYWCSDEPIQY